MEFDRSMPSHGDPDRVLELALRLFAGNGFRVTDTGADFVELEGPGMNSTRGSSVLGASHMRIEADGAKVRLRAHFGGLKRMRTQLILLPIGLGIFLLVLFFWLFGDLEPTVVVLLALAPVTPWLILTPVLVLWIRGRIGQALDALLQHLVTATGGNGGTKGG